MFLIYIQRIFVKTMIPNSPDLNFKKIKIARFLQQVPAGSQKWRVTCFVYYAAASSLLGGYHFCVLNWFFTP
jgi:hypothetical protein